MGVEVNIPQSKALLLPSKFKAFVGGYGSGKTYVACVSMVNHALKYPRVTQGYFAPTYRDIEDTFYPTMEEVAFLYGAQTEVHLTRKEVTLFFNGVFFCKIKCRSMDKPSSIVGFKIGNAVIDEIDVLDMDKATKAHMKIIARLRWKDTGGVQNGAMYTTTPEGFNFMHKTFVENIEQDPSLGEYYGIVHASTRDNEMNLPSGYIDSLLASYPRELRKAYINGEFTNLTSGTVYYSYDRNKHVSRETVEGKETIHIGLDFNIGKMAARIFVQRKDGFHCVDEIVDGFDTPGIISILDDRYPDNEAFVYPDSSGKHRDTRGGGASSSDLALLKLASFRVKAPKKNPRVKDRVLSVNNAFEKGNVFVNSIKCPMTAKGLERQPYKNGVPDKDSDFDHGNDGFGYFVINKFPVKKKTFREF